MENAKRTGDDRESALRRELIELRASVQRVEDQAGWREDNLRRELAVSSHPFPLAFPLNFNATFLFVPGPASKAACRRDEKRRAGLRDGRHVAAPP